MALFTLKGEAVAVAVAEMASREMLATKTGIVAQTKRVIMKLGIYTKAWKMAGGVLPRRRRLPSVNCAEVV